MIESQSGEVVRKMALVVILIVYILCAVNSRGFYHPDEHYQIIEFAGLKMGWNTGYDLPWEYDYQIRPTIQPWLAWLLFKGCVFFQIRDHFVLSALLRILTALFSIFAIIYFIRCFKSTVKTEYHFAFIFFSFCLWFFPAINVRFSSETWGGLFLLIAVGGIQLNRKGAYHLLLIGLLLGASFEFRFQMALAILGIILWLVFIRKLSCEKLCWVLLGGLVVLIFGVVMDSFFYGHFVFTPYNYFKINIINHVASSFGTAPWYAYITSILYAPTLLLGLPILLAIILLLIYECKNIILWIILPFIVIHSLIPHKELRFLFPLINFIPLLLVYAYQLIGSKIKQNDVVKVLSSSLLFAFLVVNLGGLFMMMFKPAGDGRINMAYYIHKKYDGANLLRIYCPKNENPYVVGVGKGLKANFYFQDNFVLGDLANDDFLRSDSNRIVLVYKGDYKEREKLKHNHFKLKKSAMPEWIIKMNYFYQVFNENSVLLLYEQGYKNETD